MERVGLQLEGELLHEEVDVLVDLEPVQVVRVTLTTKICQEKFKLDEDHVKGLITWSLIRSPP